jgi:hypothetical protein
MEEPQRWYELLSSLVSSPEEQVLLAEAAGISPRRLVRWMAGLERPCPYALYQLFCALPYHHQGLLELTAQEFAAYCRRDGTAQEPAGEIAPVFYDRVLSAAVSLPQPLRFWAISNLVLQQAGMQLDPGHQGLSLMLVRCMPPSRGGRVRSLRASIGSNTLRLWSTEPTAFFYGRESLAGYVVSSARLTVVELPPTHLGGAHQALRQEWALSAAAAPIGRGRLIAGCLLVGSSQPHYFRPSLLTLLSRYSALLLPAFAPQEFYPLESIDLYTLPALEVQQPLLEDQHRRLAQLLKEALRQQHLLDLEQIEALAWRQLEEELLTLATPADQES